MAGATAGAERTAKARMRLHVGLGVAAAAAVAVAVLGAVALAAIDPPVLRKADFDRLRPGATAAEAEAMFGPADFGETQRGTVRSPTTFFANADAATNRSPEFRDYDYRQWDWAGVHVSVVFDGGRVACSYHSVQPPVGWRQGVVRRWFGW